MLKLGRKILSFRKRIVAIVVGVTMVTLSLLFTNDMARACGRRNSTKWPSGYTPWSA